IVTVLTAAAVGGFLASLLRQPLLLGYLGAGMLVGPTGLGLIKELVQVETLAQFGVTFLLFTLGVEFSLGQLGRVRGIALGGGSLQMLLTMAMTTVAALLTGWVKTPVQGIFLGAVLSLSSTAVVLKSLMAKNQVETPHGQAMLGILIVQDLAVGLMLGVLPALDHPLSELGWAVGRAVVEMGLFGGGAVVAGIWVVPSFLRLLAQRESKELFLLGVISLCAGIALLTERMGISSEMGAFVAGLMISGVEYADQTLDYVEPLRDVFAALFFVSIGMLIDPLFITEHALLISGLVALVMVGKFLITAPVTWLFGYSPQSALLVGVGLSQIGEFSFVLASEGQSLGFISRSLYLLLASTTAVTLVVTPFLLNVVPRLFPWLEKIPGFKQQDPVKGSSPHLPGQGHVIIGGYGQVGRDLVRLLEGRGYPLLVIDQSERAIQELRQRGIPYLYGNVASPLLLEKANVMGARALVITVADPLSGRLCLKRVRERCPELLVIIRAPKRDDIEQLYQLGASEVIHGEFETSLGLCSYLLQQLGEPLPLIQQEIMGIRDSHYMDLRPSQPSCLLPPSEATAALHPAWWETWPREKLLS
ncbi:MAG: cation:proton antiporter, partial [Thermostichales cyanobacterium SZTDM-1c_bins_54]